MPDYKQQQPQAGFSTENNPNQFNQSANQWAGSPQYQPNQLQDQQQQEQETSKKGRKHKLYRFFEIVFQLHNPDCFLDDSPINVPELLEQSSHRPLTDTIYSVLASQVIVKNFYCSLHDKDVNIYNEPEKDHVHILIELSSEEEGLSVKELSKITGVKEQQITIPKDQYFMNNKAAYLIHAVDDAKAQYDPEDVISYYDEEAGGEPYQALYDRCSSKWSEARLANINKANGGPSGEVGILIQQILAGTFGPSGYGFMRHPHWRAVYGSSRKNRSNVDNACEIFKEAYMDATREAFKQHLLNKLTFFVYGQSGAGKSRLCENIAELLKAKILKLGMNWEIAYLHGKNAIDDYAAQEICIFDDMRADKKSGDQWCLILDPDRPNSAEARYSDVYYSALFTMLNQTKNLIDFFKPFAFKHDEPIDQFLRRIPFQIEVRTFEAYGEELRQARIVPVVKLPAPQVIRESQSEYAKEIEVNYWPDTTQAGEWKSTEIIAEEVVDLVIERTPCLGVNPTDLSQVVMSNGECKSIPHYDDLLNASVMKNDRAPHVFEFALGTSLRPNSVIKNKSDVTHDEDIKSSQANPLIVQACLKQLEAERNKDTQILEYSKAMMYSVPPTQAQSQSSSNALQPNYQGNQSEQQFNQSAPQAQNGFNMQPSGNASSASNSQGQNGQGGNYYQQPNNCVQQAHGGSNAPQQSCQGNQWGQQFNQPAQQVQNGFNGFNMQQPRNAPSASNWQGQSGQRVDHYQQPNNCVQQAHGGFNAPQQSYQGNQWRQQLNQPAQQARNGTNFPQWNNQGGNWSNQQCHAQRQNQQTSNSFNWNRNRSKPNWEQ